MTSANSDYKIALVGAGPIGIECAIALKQHGADYIHLDRGQIASTIEWYAPGTTFFSSPERIALANVPLYTATQGKATREEYLLYLRSLVSQFELPIHTYSSVTEITKSDDRFWITYEDKNGLNEISVDRVILAIGDMHQPRELGIPGEGLPHVSHYLKEPHGYFQKKVLIVGGKNSAVEAAIRLARVGADVTISYRGKVFDEKRIKYWLYPEIQFMIRQRRISFFPLTAPVSISKSEVELESLVKNVPNRVVDVDQVLLLTGYVQEKSLFESMGIELEGENQKPILNEDTMESTVPGAYVIGTAIAGTQMGGVKEFIETGHEHVSKVMGSLFHEKHPSKELREVDREFLEN